MSRTVRLVCAALLACGSVPLTGVGVAAADEASLTPASSAYFFSKGVDKPDESPAAPPNVTGIVADGVAPGNLAVAADAGGEDKVSFLYFDVFSLPVDATIAKAVVTMTPVPNGPEGEAVNVSYNQAPEAVIACKAGPQGFKDDDGAGLANAPERLCAAFKAVGKAGPAGSYQWDVTGLAQEWLSGSNDGIAFTRADDGPGNSFQVVFGKAATAKLAITYTAAETVPPVVAPPLAPPPVAPPLSVGGAVTPPTDGFAPTPEVVVPNPQANPAPTTAQPAAAARPVALSTSLRPTNQFWLAALGIALALVLVSLVMGDPAVPAAARSRSRLVLALEGRRPMPSFHARTV